MAARRAALSAALAVAAAARVAVEAPAGPPMEDWWLVQD